MVTSTEKQLKEAIRLGIRPCSFCKLKRTSKCEKQPPVIVSKIVPNLKRIYQAPCPSSAFKDNLFKIIDCYFHDENVGSSLNAIFESSKFEYQKVILDNIRPCNICSADNLEICKTCTSEEIQIDLLQVVDDFFDRYTKEIK